MELMVQTYLVWSFLSFHVSHNYSVYGVLVLGFTVVGIFADFDQSLTVVCTVLVNVVWHLVGFRGSSKVNLNKSKIKVNLK